MLSPSNYSTSHIPWPLASPGDATPSLLGPPLPTWWPRPARRILLNAEGRSGLTRQGHKIGLGPDKLALQIATRWD